MNTLNEAELATVEGGNPILIGWGITVYMNTLNKIEQNPQEYTWLMDWYYEN